MSKDAWDTFVELLCWMVYGAGVNAFGENLQFWVARTAPSKPWCLL